MLKVRSLSIILFPLLLSGLINGQDFIESGQPEPEAGAHFGWAITAYGDMAIATAPFASDSVGAAYFYSEVNESFEIDTVFIPELPAGSQFGMSADMEYGLAAIGSYNTSRDSLGKGGVYIFEYDYYDSYSRSLDTVLTGEDTVPGDDFGCSVSVVEYNNIVVVGACKADDKGAAYIFQKINNEWELVRKLSDSEGKSGDRFGHTVLYRNERIFVGAPGADGDVDNSGSVYVFEEDDKLGWMLSAKLYDPAGFSGDQFGYAISSSAWFAILVKESSNTSPYLDNIYIGAPDKPHVTHSGSVFIAGENDTTGWNLLHELTLPGSGPQTHLGTSVAHNGMDGLFVMANQQKDSEEGEIYRFNVPWTYQPEQVIDSEVFTGAEATTTADRYDARIVMGDEFPVIMIGYPNYSDEEFTHSGKVEFYITMLSSNEEETARPEQFYLEQNYPNPFNPSTVIRYQLPEPASVKLEIFDLMGRKISTLLNRRQSAGAHSIEFDASDLSSGVYIYRLQTGGFVSTKKMMLIK